MDELVKLKVNDVQKPGDIFVVDLPDTKTTERLFVIKGPFVEIVQKYINIRPPHTTTDRFFVNYRNSKCTTQPIGPNKMKKFPRRIAEFLNLPEPHRYTGIKLNSSKENY